MYSGPTVISPNNQFIISNAASSFKVLLTSTLQEVYSVKNNTENTGKLLPLVLAHHGTMLLSGSTKGKPRLWRCLDGEHMHVLHITGELSIAAVEIKIKHLLQSQIYHP